MTDFKDLSLGDEIQIRYHSDIAVRLQEPSTRIWTIEKIYPHHIFCTCGVLRECFTYGEMIQLGYEHKNQPMAKEVMQGQKGKVHETLIDHHK